MRLLHGSNVEIVTPNLKKCQSRNDFGRGFYLTPQWQRAYLMAKRRASRDGGEPVVTPFLFYPTKAQEHGLKVKEFKGRTNQRIRNMEERYFKFEDLMADLAAYLVSEYDIEPRDAAGLVMNSPQTQALYSSEEPITEQRVKALAEELLKEGKG